MLGSKSILTRGWIIDFDINVSLEKFLFDENDNESIVDLESVN